MPYAHDPSVKKRYLAVRGALMGPFLRFRKTARPCREEIRRILFLRYDRIGDMVVSTAALKALKHLFPGSHLAVLASSSNAPILHHNPSVDQVMVFRGFPSLLKDLRGKPPDLIVDPYNAYEMANPLWSFLLGGKYRLGFSESGRELFFNLPAPSLTPVKPLGLHLHELVSQLGEVPWFEPELFVTEEELEWARKRFREMGMDRDRLRVAIHPGGYYPSQRWPRERFGALGARIARDFDAEILWITGPGEAPWGRELVLYGKGCGHWLGNLSLRNLLGVLKLSHVFIGNNSGPLHVAAALGLFTVSTLGPTVSPLWVPAGERHAVLDKRLPCSPCNRGWCEEHTCMKRITVEDMAAAFEDLVGKQGGAKDRSDAW